MSYEIIYDKQFIKLSNNKYIPMVLAGSNNCYQVNWRNGRERRERDWFPWPITSELAGEEAEFIAYWEKARKEIIERNQSKYRDSWYEEYSDNGFGYWTALSLKGKSCSQTSYKNITGVFTTGIKKSLTIEQLAEEGVRVVVKTGYISNKNIDIKPFSKVVANEVEMLKAINECKIHTGESSVETTIDFYGMQDETPKQLRKRYFPAKAKREKTLVEFPKYYTIKIDESGNYLVKRTRNGYNYSYYPYLQFATKKEAESKVNRYNKRYGKIYNVEEILEPAKIWV